MACKNHPDRESVAACVACGEELCAECDAKGADDKSYCANDLPAVAVPAPVAPAPVTAAPVAFTAPPMAAAAPVSGGGNMTLAAVGYLVWICALISVLIEKEDKQVKYHAWNALFWGLAYTVVMVAVSILRVALHQVPGMGMIFGLVSGLVPLAFLILSIIFLMKALKREDVNIPVISDLARKQAGV